VVVTHSGDFHADDVFACAAISLWANKNKRGVKIIRSRDADVWAKADILIDVGDICDLERNKFDHHQKNGPKRENGAPYASFGLVWKIYGEKLCESLDVSLRIDKNLALPVDARDNGINISQPVVQTGGLKVYDHRTSNMISNFNAVESEGEDQGKQFLKAIKFAEEILKREIIQSVHLEEDMKKTEKVIFEQNEPGILILDERIEWYEAVSRNKKIKFVVYPQKNGTHWSVQCGRDDLEDYNSDRANLPASWHGLRGEELIKVSGIKDASFCTNVGWFGTARSKEGAIAMAEKSLQNGQN